MGEIDSVARFKAFATNALLAQLHPVSGSAWPKQAAYEGVRKAYTTEFGWPTELDEIEPGPAQTPRWLNRLHWTVADLVQAGILEKSSGSDDLRATENGQGADRARGTVQRHAPDPRVAGGSGGSPDRSSR